MPSQTINYNLTKPGEEEFYDIKIFNANSDIIDAQMKANANAIATKAGASDLATTNAAVAALQADYATFKSATQTDISAIEKELANYKGSTSGTDANVIDTIIEYHRQDDTLYVKKTLSNPNANGQYQTDTWQEYASDGTTVVQTVVWTYGYKATDTNPNAMPNSWSWVVV